MAMLHTATPPSGDVQQKLEDYTGLKIDFSWIPDASKEEKINAALASQSLADIVSLSDMTNSSVRNALNSGMFWDVKGYLKDYPNLAKISKDRLAAATMDGHVYGVPVQKPMARYGVLVRQDWLDNLGLEVPHTVEDLEKVAQAFTENDPDGNGKKDTVGIVERNESFNVGFKSLSGYFGAGCDFAVVDGKVVPSFMQDEFTEAMEWMHNIYQQGWMNSDFSVMAKNDQKDYIIQGKGGIVFSGLMEAKNYVNGTIGTPQEGVMKWALINDMTAGDEKHHILSDTGGGFGGLMAIPKNEVKTKADLKVVLKFINDLMDEEPFDLMTNGEKGVHYTENADGAVEITDTTKWQQEVQPFASSRPSELVTTFKSTDPLQNESNEKIAENEKSAVINPAQTLSSTTYDEQWSTLIEGVKDAFYKYMMNEIDMDGFEDAVKSFQDAGGDQIIKEFTADYNKQNK